MSDEEDTTILLNHGNNNIESIANKSVNEDYQCILERNLKKQNPKQYDNLIPLQNITSRNQNILISIVALLAGIAFGCDMSIIKPMAPFIKNEFELNCFEINLLIGIWFMGALLGGLTGGIAIDSFGRRWTMILMLMFLIFGTVLSALVNHYVLLLISRIICGYSSTVSTVSHCIYMAEVSESNKRGYNIILYQLGAAVGFLMTIIAAIFITLDHQWRFSLGIIVVPALIACITTVLFLQKSPPFLLLKRAKNVISKTTSKGSKHTIFEILSIMVFMMILQQTTGREQVLYYAPRLFVLLGICPNTAEVTALISLGIVKIFSTILSLVIVEKCGRRTALITSATICMTTISLLSLLATIDRGSYNIDIEDTHCKRIAEKNIQNIIPIGSPPPFPLLPTPLAVIESTPETWTQIKASCENQSVVFSEGFTNGLRILAVTTLLVYEAAYTLGLGPVPLLNLSEFFPVSIRGKCASFAITVMWTTHILTIETVNKIIRSMTLAGSYLFYSFMCLITIFYIFLFIPETKGKSLHQIAQELNKISIVTRLCKNVYSLPLICHIKWIKKYENTTNKKQSILI
uniref:solute carrier family 2, facilitated glucose transporter member 10-like n=1 Tax=Vespula vulgaris TaxID=7454 RepID=UPI002137A328|nr:solute carrier family 2, facilitated glucose transporter member 10-like [Vespula vulgaris]XP_050847144.1 solute carrier family 2, facilitated glucose transporter member 10-like [Vespula vulgaris]XP_050847145.1 solute carrier family 2, facilitated glucose transporter member 10-like [Vespula vulgaris]XP_050847146.1 solute carrier family 2, facilitated glucose transporter member 10-like [Vespula vulgaris]